MKKKIIFIIICFVVAGFLYLGYEKYRKEQYISNAKAYKEYICTATEIAKGVIEKTDELKTMSSVIKKKHETTYYKSMDEASKYSSIAFKYIMDNNWQVNDMRNYSKDILDSCVREASVLLNAMRDNQDCYPYDHQAFETALKTIRPIIRRYEEENFTKEFYQSSMRDIQSIYDCLSETDINMGDLSKDYKKNVKGKAAGIIKKSYHGNPVDEATLMQRYKVYQ